MTPRATDGEYAAHLQALLPLGSAWPRSAGATQTALTEALAPELARAHNRAADLVEEADPRTTSEMLADWERVTGLPDECLGLGADEDARRAAVVARLISRGGQSAAYYIGLCAAFGWEIDITDLKPFTCGESECGDQVLEGDGAVFRTGDSQCGDYLDEFALFEMWQIDGPPTVVEYFECGHSECGDHLSFEDNPALRCLIDRLAPAHTLPIYKWTKPEV